MLNIAYKPLQLASAEKCMGCGWEGAMAKCRFGKMIHLQEEAHWNAVVGFRGQLGEESNIQHKTAVRVSGELLVLGASRKCPGESYCLLTSLWSP